MPKTGLTVSEWKQRLRAFARGEYSFGRGQKPPKNSHWAREIMKIEACPLFSSLSARGPCTCGYHVTGSSTGARQPTRTGAGSRQEHRQGEHADNQHRDVGRREEGTGHQHLGRHQDVGLQPHPAGLPSADVRSLPEGTGHQHLGHQQDVGLQPHPVGLPSADARSLPEGTGHQHLGHQQDVGLQPHPVGLPNADARSLLEGTGHQHLGCHQDVGLQPHPASLPSVDVRSPSPEVQHRGAGSQLHPPAGPVGGIQRPGVRHAVTQSSTWSPWNRPSTSKKSYAPKIVPRAKSRVAGSPVDPPATSGASGIAGTNVIPTDGSSVDPPMSMESSVDPDPLLVTSTSTAPVNRSSFPVPTNRSSLPVPTNRTSLPGPANRTSLPVIPQVTCPPSSVDRPVPATITLAPAIVSRPAPASVNRHAHATSITNSAPASISISRPAPVSHPTPTTISTGPAPITISHQDPAVSSLLPVTTSGAFQPTVASRVEESMPSCDQYQPANQSSSVQSTSGTAQEDSLTLGRSAVDYSLRLPKGWIGGNMAAADQQWVGKHLFSAKGGKLSTNLKLWWHPPEDRGSGTPKPEHYYRKPLFLWMPRRLWRIDFKCPNCSTPRSLRSKGVYNKIRLVMDLKGFYYLAAEYMDCNYCSKTYTAYDDRILEQLTDNVRVQFPVVLTHKFACDVAVISLLRSRTLGNSPTALRNSILEVHSEQWLKKSLSYMSDCERHKNGLLSLRVAVPEYQRPLDFPKFPGARWMLDVYTEDVRSRLPQLKAAITSTYGSVIKIDSTKKICRKLAGAAAGTATWQTNVGNEKGEVLLSVVTDSEALVSLKPMADGLMKRYRDAGQDAPVLLYTDRDCCNRSNPSKFLELFDNWCQLQVRLDVWHFMRRLARGCTSESHPLYGTFMCSLSSCLFEWDQTDFDNLVSAKRAELVRAGVSEPTPSSIRKAISKEELANHCKRRTRGCSETIEQVEALLLAMSPATDSLGARLFNEEMQAIWEEQKRHVGCLQDPPDVSLYTVTGSVTKGGVTLPTYRCARGTTSLESFHLHLASFIPGTSASDLHYQVYLLEGITRWNQARALAAIDQQEPRQRLLTYDIRLGAKVNELSQKLFCQKILPYHQTPSQPTGELFGLDYLRRQAEFLIGDEACVGDDVEVDEGLGDESMIYQSALSISENLSTFSAPVDSDEEEEEDDETEVRSGEAASGSALDTLPPQSSSSSSSVAAVAQGSEALDSLGIPGWDKVDQLARALVDLHGLSVSNEQARNIQMLYHQLPDYDKKPLSYAPRQSSSTPARGRFGRSKRSHTTVDQMKRCFLSAGSPAFLPSKSRLVEAICILLLQKYPTALKRRTSGLGSGYTSRWKLVLSEYNSIRLRLFNSQALLEGTNLVLFNINEGVLIRWFKNNTRREEVTMMMQGLNMPTVELCTTSQLPPPMTRPSSPPSPPMEPMLFEEPEDTYGLARVRTGSTSVRANNPPQVNPVASTSCSSGTTTSTHTFTTEQSATDVSPASPIPTSSSGAVSIPSGSSTSVVPEADSLSRTTMWRRMKRQEEAAQDDGGPPAKKRKAYSCSKCGKPKTGTGHSQYKGRRYCPFEPGQVSKEEWLRRVKLELSAAAIQPPASTDDA